MYIDLCLRYRVRYLLMCTLMFDCLQGEGKVIVYKELCLMYRVRYVLMCSIICV